MYVVKAAVEAPIGKEHLLTPSTMAEMLRLTNQHHTGSVPSVLPLYIGMTVLLQSKDCVRFGLMKGCECRVEQIFFDELEVLPTVILLGQPVELSYVPQYLLLRALGTAWSLPQRKLPQLPLTADRQGLFLLSPKSVYLKRQVTKGEYCSFKRTNFQVVPADTRIVYAAQGATFKAVVADMERPPRMDSDTHWLACYVMMSRATSIEGFLVLRPAFLCELSRPPPQYLVAEIDRLLALERTSISELSDYIDRLPQGLVPDTILGLFRNGADSEEAQAVRNSRQSLRLPELGLSAPTQRKATETAGAAKRRRLVGKQSVSLMTTPSHTFSASETSDIAPVPIQPNMTTFSHTAAVNPCAFISVGDPDGQTYIPQLPPAASQAPTPSTTVSDAPSVTAVSSTPPATSRHTEVLREWTRSAAEERATHASQLGIGNVDTVAHLQQDSALRAARGTDVLFCAAGDSALRAALQRSRLAARSTDARISSAVALPSTASVDRNNSSASVASQGEPAEKLRRVDRSFVPVWPGPGATSLQNIASEGSGAADNATSSSSGAPSGAGLSTAAATLPLSEPCPDTRSLRPSSVHSNGPSSMRSTWSGAAFSSSAPPSHHPVTMPASRCSNCDRLGCSPADPQCPFYMRARGFHGDAGWGDSVPHMTQMEWRLLSDGSVEIEGTQWSRGRALGDGNNCLIDTLRQACDKLAVSTSRVRSRLQQLFRS